jgi:hypothetical protein
MIGHIIVASASSAWPLKSTAPSESSANIAHHSSFASTADAYQKLENTHGIGRAKIENHPPGQYTPQNPPQIA